MVKLFEEEEAARSASIEESPEHKKAKNLIAAELARRIAAGTGLPWAFRDPTASDFPLVGNLLLGAERIETEHTLRTPFLSLYRLDVAILAPKILNKPFVIGAIEIERTHAFDGRKALLGRSMGFPLISIDISEMSESEITEEWAAQVLSQTAHSSKSGRRQTYVYLHDLNYPQYLHIPTADLYEEKHQYLVFADDKTIDALIFLVNKLSGALGYKSGEVTPQKLTGKSTASLRDLERVGSIVGDGWEAFNERRCLRISVPRPLGMKDVRGHLFHGTLARILLSKDCLVGYQYEAQIYNERPDEVLWIKKAWRKEHGMYEYLRIAPKRLAEPITRVLEFFNSCRPTP